MDLNHHDDFQLISYLKRNPKSLIGISMTTPQYKEGKRIAELIKRNFSKTTIVAGGAHPTSMKGEISPIFDHVIVGEGEIIFTELAQNQSSTIAYDRVIFGKPIEQPSPRSLDNHPIPARHLIDMSKYSLKINDRKASTIMTSLGCPFHCSFCSEPILSNQFRARSPNLVVEEMELINKKYGIEGLIIYDDVYTIDSKRCVEIARLMNEKKLNISYRATTRANLVQKVGLLKALKDSNCVELCLGVESGSDKILKTNDKGMNTKINFDAIQAIKEAGIKVLTYMIIGLPGETPETIQESIEFAKKANPDECSWYLLAPFPSTPLWINRDNLDITIYEDEIIANDWDICQAMGDNEKITPYISTSACSREMLKDMWLKAMSQWENRKSIQNNKKRTFYV
jgi:radical SAM superfamily enzyme YgiQ (UPF0313 family)